MRREEALERLTFIDSVQIFALLYVVSVGVMFYVSKRTGKPFVVPGDIYNLKQGRRMYFPTGGAFFLAVALFFLLMNIRNRIGS